jgi:hypothetical protein
VEEVSASVEEMSAQVEEVNASAQSLANMAEALQDIVRQFKLNQTDARQVRTEPEPERMPPSLPSIKPLIASIPVKPVNGNGHYAKTLPLN